MSASPVALFVYNRADNTRHTLEALMANTLAPQTEVYVFSDGGRDDASWALVGEVRRLLREVEARVRATHALRALHIIERPVNYYLERNVIEGIAYVLERHPTIIVLEDDIVTSPYFLDYMNTAFDIYRVVSLFEHFSPMITIPMACLDLQIQSVLPVITKTICMQLERRNFRIIAIQIQVVLFKPDVVI